MKSARGVLALAGVCGVAALVVVWWALRTAAKVTGWLP